MSREWSARGLLGRYAKLLQRIQIFYHATYATNYAGEGIWVADEADASLFSELVS